MTGIVLSIILILGLQGGPTNDFNNSGTTDSSVATSQVNTVKHSK